MSKTEIHTLVGYDEVRRRLDYDAHTGLFRWAESGNGRVLGQRAGWIKSDGYIAIALNGRQYLAHRLAWLYVHGKWPAASIDHINGIRSDNRIFNLRDVPQSINNQNFRRARKHGLSGYLGASKASLRRWRAQIVVGGVKHYLGLFKSPEEAHVAYVTAKRRLHEGCEI